MRSIQSDSFRPSLVALVLAFLLLIGWSIWFTAGRITLYETAPVTKLTEDGTILAEFPSEKRPLFKVSQYGWLHLPDASGTGTTDLPIVLMDVRPDESKKVVELKLYTPHIPAESIVADGNAAQVEIAVGSLSPAAMILQASKQVQGPSNLSLGPDQLLQNLRRQ